MPHRSFWFTSAVFSATKLIGAVKILTHLRKTVKITVWLANERVLSMSKIFINNDKGTSK